jgi:predicted nucleic acid-binding protein
MGIMLDSSILIKAERRGISLTQLLRETRSQFGAQPVEVSVVTISELTHGVFRAENPVRAMKRQMFNDAILQSLLVHDLTIPIALKVGEIEARLAARGFAIGFEDAVIGTTALLLQYAVLTANVRHFQLIPGLTVLSV